MNREERSLLARPGEGGRIVLLSPAVGFYSTSPGLGEGLVPGSHAGVLTILGRRIDLRVPAAASGRLEEIVAGDRVTAVEYGQPLLVLRAEAGLHPSSGEAEEEDRGADLSSAETPRGETGASADQGRHMLRAPTAGIFYGRPDPESPPFVTAGSVLETGQTAGLIEVMKCFSPILHPGGAVPSPAVVEEVRARDGEEVRPGQILFVISPSASRPA